MAAQSCCWLCSTFSSSCFANQPVTRTRPFTSRSRREFRLSCFGGLMSLIEASLVDVHHVPIEPSRCRTGRSNDLYADGVTLGVDDGHLRKIVCRRCRCPADSWSQGGRH